MTRPPAVYAVAGEVYPGWTFANAGFVFPYARPGSATYALVRPWAAVLRGEPCVVVLADELPPDHQARGREFTDAVLRLGWVFDATPA